MAQALSYNRTLLRFELANTGLGEAGGSHFALTLKENVALQVGTGLKKPQPPTTLTCPPKPTRGSPALET